MGFIYKVTNNLNGKVYIGQSIFPIQIRFKEHLNDCDKFLHRPFYDAIKKYGKENFSISLIEEVDSDKLNEREQYWIKQYNSYVNFPNSNGYNATLGGDSRLLYDYKIIVDDYLKTKSKEQTMKNLHCCKETVDRALSEYNISTFANNAGRPIARIDDDGNQKEYASIREAAYEISDSQNKNMQTVRKRINDLLLHKPNQKAYGYFWRFV